MQKRCRHGNAQLDTREREGQLEHLYRDGLSFALIAAEIGVSRNAVIGKVHRMCLPKRTDPQSQKPSPKKRKREPMIRVRKTEAAPPVPAPVVIDPNRDYRCDILGLTETTCRFPLWAVNAPHERRLYCGCPGASLTEKIPYCERHSLLCGTPRQN